MAKGGASSNNSESNGAIMVIEATLEAAADKLRNNPNRTKQIKILGLNLGIAAAYIITLKIGILEGGALGLAFGSTIFFLSAVGVIYGNYRLFAEPERSEPERSITTPDDYREALNKHRPHKTFEEDINLAIDQIARLQKKNKNILEILPQIFGDSKITCNKFIAAIDEVGRARRYSWY
jgi:membrane glycosyltransferase